MLLYELIALAFKGTEKNIFPYIQIYLHIPFSNALRWNNIN